MTEQQRKIHKVDVSELKTTNFLSLLKNTQIMNSTYLILGHQKFVKQRFNKKKTLHIFF